MDCFFSDFDFPNLDFPHDFSSYFPTSHQETSTLDVSHMTMGLHGMDLMVPPPLPFESNLFYSNNQFTELENFNYNFSGFDFNNFQLSCNDMVIDEKPCTTILPNHFQSFNLPISDDLLIKEMEMASSVVLPNESHHQYKNFEIQSCQSATSLFDGNGFSPLIKQDDDDHETRIFRICYNKKKRSANLELDDIRNYFDVPITTAAKKLNVGLTLLKRRCRELNITRWPHRKIKSIKTLIDNVKELGLVEEVAMLEKHKRLMEKMPDVELSEQTKKLRQACFKANYKRRRFLALHAPA